MGIEHRSSRPIRLVAAFLVLMSLGLSSRFALTRTWTGSSPGGTPDYAGNPPRYKDCSECHTGEPTCRLRITDVSGNGISNRFNAGQKYDWVVELSDTDPAHKRWGFELAIMWDCTDSALVNSSAGTLASADESTILKDGTTGGPTPMPDPRRKFLTHYGVRQGDLPDGTFGGAPGGARWRFSWTAPEKTDPPCPLKIYMTGVGANGDSATAGDCACLATMAINFNNPTASRHPTWGSLKTIWR